MTAAAPRFDAVPDAIPASQASSLHAWNVRLSAIRAVQALLILALSFAKNPMVTAPVVSSYLTFDTATKTLVPAQRALFGLPIGVGSSSTPAGRKLTARGVRMSRC